MAQLNDCENLYNQLKPLDLSQKNKLIGSYWVKGNLEIKRKSRLGRWLHRWIVTHWIFSKRYSIPKAISNLQQIYKEEPSRILHTCDVLTLFVNRLNENKRKPLIDKLESVRKNALSPPAKPPSKEELLKTTETLFSAENMSEGSAALKRYLASEEDPTPALELAACFFEKDKKHIFKKILGEIAEHETNTTFLCTHLKNEALKRPLSFVEEFTQTLLELNPLKIEPLIIIGKAFIDENKNEYAQVIVDAILKMDPLNESTLSLKKSLDTSIAQKLLLNQATEAYLSGRKEDGEKALQKYFEIKGDPTGVLDLFHTFCKNNKLEVFSLKKELFKHVKGNPRPFFNYFEKVANERDFVDTLMANILQNYPEGVFDTLPVAKTVLSKGNAQAAYWIVSQALIEHPAYIAALFFKSELRKVLEPGVTPFVELDKILHKGFTNIKALKQKALTLSQFQSPSFSINAQSETDSWFQTINPILHLHQSLNSDIFVGSLYLTTKAKAWSSESIDSILKKYNDPELLVLSCRALMESDSPIPDEIFKGLSIVPTKNPYYAIASVYRSHILMKQNKEDQALQVLEESLRQKPGEIYLLLTRAKLCAHTNVAQARKDLAEIFWSLAEKNIPLIDFFTEKDLDAIAHLEPDYVPLIHTRVLIRYMHHKNDPETKNLITHALGIEPNNTRLLLFRALVSYENEPENATEDIRKVLEIDPQNEAARAFLYNFLTPKPSKEADEIKAKFDKNSWRKSFTEWEPYPQNLAAWISLRLKRSELLRDTILCKEDFSEENVILAIQKEGKEIFQEWF